jgi:hypothetical protein
MRETQKAHGCRLQPADRRDRVHVFDQIRVLK